jgi:TRAP-type C4-dicarboxylate transport system permease small subunit
MVDPLRRRFASKNTKYVKKFNIDIAVLGFHILEPKHQLLENQVPMVRRIYERLEESIPLAFFLLIFFLMTMGVFNRYLFNTSFSWNIELCRYSFVWLTFVGAAYVRKDDSHIKIEFLINLLNNKLPLGARKAVWFFKEILTIGFLIQLVYLGFILACKSWRFKSQAMQIPQFFLYISVSVGGALYLLREIPGAYRYYKKAFLAEVE